MTRIIEKARRGFVYREPRRLREKWKNIRRERLLRQLIIELEQDGNSITKLYSALLANALLECHHSFFHEHFAARIFEATNEPPSITKDLR